MKLHLARFWVGLIFFFYFNGYAGERPKSYLSLKLSYEHGFSHRNMQLFDAVINDFVAYGASGSVSHNYSFTNTPLSIVSSLGVYAYSFHGSILNERYSGAATKVEINESIGYLINESWTSSMGVSLLNNRSAEDFASKKNDMFRFDLTFSVSYKLYKQYSIQMAYARALNCTEDLYAYQMPLNRLQLGFKMDFIK